MKKLLIAALVAVVVLAVGGAAWAAPAQSPNYSVTPTIYFQLYAPIPLSNFDANFTVQLAEWTANYKQHLVGQLQIPWGGNWTLMAHLGNVAATPPNTDDKSAAEAFKIHGGVWGDFSDENTTVQIGNGSGTTPRNILYAWNLNELSDNYAGRTAEYNVDFYYMVP